MKEADYWLLLYVCIEVCYLFVSTEIKLRILMFKIALIKKREKCKKWLARNPFVYHKQNDNFLWIPDKYKLTSFCGKLI